MLCYLHVLRMEQNRPNPYVELIAAISRGLDVSQVFKTKGKLRRWSAKRTIGGLVVMEAIYQIHYVELSTLAVILCGVGVLPLCLSFFEK